MVLTTWPLSNFAVCEPISTTTMVLGGLSAGTSALGAIGQYQQGQQQATRANTVAEYNRLYQNQVNQQNYLNQQAQVRAANQGRVNAYVHQLQIRDQNFRRDKALYESDVQGYYAEVADNQFAAQEGYARAQRQLNEVFKQAAFEEQGSLIELLESTGAAASGRTGRSAQRIDNAVMAKWGRNNAVKAASLSSSKEGYQQAVQDIDRQMRDANAAAFDEVAFAPKPDMMPLKPQLLADPTPPMAAPGTIPVQGPSGLSLATGLLGAGLDGYNTYQGLQAPQAQLRIR